MCPKLIDCLKNTDFTPQPHNVEIGNVYNLIMHRSDGLSLPKNKNNKNKFFIVLGFTKDGNIFGGFIINSVINQDLPDEIKLYHYKIKATLNNFLEYDSFVNCTKIFSIVGSRLSYNNYAGILDKDSLKYVIGTIFDKDNITITEKERREYNIQNIE